MPTWPAPGPLGGPKLWHRTCLSALDVGQGQSCVHSSGEGTPGELAQK